AAASLSRPGQRRCLPSSPTRRSSDLSLALHSKLAHSNHRGGEACQTGGPEDQDDHSSCCSTSLQHSSWVPHNRTARSRTRLANRSEEHTSELQSRENLVCRLLLGKKK